MCKWAYVLKQCLESVATSGLTELVGFAEQGITVNRRRIGRLMVQAGLWCKTKKKFKVGDCF